MIGDPFCGAGGAVECVTVVQNKIQSQPQRSDRSVGVFVEYVALLECFVVIALPQLVATRAQHGHLDLDVGLLEVRAQLLPIPRLVFSLACARPRLAAPTLRVVKIAVEPLGHSAVRVFSHDDRCKNFAL